MEGTNKYATDLGSTEAPSTPRDNDAEQGANFVRFTTHALLPIFPEESWVKSKSGYVLAWSRRSDSRARKKNSRRKKTFPPPPRFPGVQLTRSPLTTALYYLDAWNRLDTCRIRVNGQIRFECGYVWTWTVLNPERKSCGFQNIRICVDGAFKFAITVSRAILIR